jgi:metal transporter CNNM
MRKTFFLYVLIIFILSRLGLFVIAQLKSTILPAVAANALVQEASRLLRRNSNHERNDSREVILSSKFQSDYPPIQLIQPQEHSKHLSSRIIRHSSINNDTCTASCCSKYSCHSAYQSEVPTCPICEECVTGNPLAFLPHAVQYVFMIILLSFSGMFAGLTLGFLSLDKTGLEVLMESDDVHTAQYATKIYPIRLKGNLLLCTLLLGNTAANSLGSILIADLFGGLVGAIVSTIVILIFGEITPQAVCSRYALYIGSHAVPIVKVIICIFYPVAKPLALTLDYALGDELATTYSSKEFIKLLQIHVEQNMLDHDTANTMTGALNYKNLPVRDVMTPLNNVFMLRTDDKLNFETIAKIFKAGYSRIPVYEISPNNVVGLLFVKDLIFIDPEDDTPVSDFIEIFGRGVHVVWPDDKLGDVLVELKRGRSHMALVRDVNHNDNNADPYYEIQGIITLEDIIEEILGMTTFVFFFFLLIYTTSYSPTT